MDYDVTVSIECYKALEKDAARYRLWRKNYDCRFALNFSDGGITLLFKPGRPKVEIAPNYERLVDTAIDDAMGKD